MKSLKVLIPSSALVLLQAGCMATPAKDSPQPAVLTQASAATTAVLNAAVSRALNGTKVSLAREVFTQSSEMQVERMAQDSAAMRGLNGRMMGVPKVYRFSLKKNAGGCYLVYQKTGVEYRLDGVTCRAL